MVQNYIILDTTLIVIQIIYVVVLNQDLTGFQLITTLLNNCDKHHVIRMSSNHKNHKDSSVDFSVYFCGNPSSSNDPLWCFRLYVPSTLFSSTWCLPCNYLRSSSGLWSSMPQPSMLCDVKPVFLHLYIFGNNSMFPKFYVLNIETIMF